MASAIVLSATEDLEYGFFIGIAGCVVVGLLLGVVYGYLFKYYGKP